jgi:hypothetical protein
MSSGDVLASISGTLCLSLACDAKLERERAAVRVLRTQERYGLSDWDWRGVSGALRSLCLLDIPLRANGSDLAIAFGSCSLRNVIGRLSSQIVKGLWRWVKLLELRLLATGYHLLPGYSQLTSEVRTTAEVGPVALHKSLKEFQSQGKQTSLSHVRCY